MPIRPGQAGSGIVSGITSEPLRATAFRTVFYASPARMFLCDRDFVIRAANAAYCEAEGLGEADLVGRPLSAMIGEAVFTAWLPLMHKALDGQATTIVDWGRRRASRNRLLRVTHLPVLDAEGEVAGFVGQLEDTTHLHALEKRIEMQDEVFSQTSDGLAVIGTDFTFQWANNAYARKWNLAPDQLIGRQVAEVVGDRNYVDTVLIPLSRCFNGETLEFEDPNRRDDGGTTLYAIRLEPMRDKDGLICAAIVNRRDITEAAALRDRLARNERHDPVTGLPNRHALEEHLGGEILASGGRLSAGLAALLAIDIDDFRIVNDISGYSAGDELLRHVASLLSALAPDSFLARTGSDGFALVVTCGSRQDALTLPSTSWRRSRRRGSTGAVIATPSGSASAWCTSSTSSPRTSRRAPSISWRAPSGPAWWLERRAGSACRCSARMIGRSLPATRR